MLSFSLKINTYFKQLNKSKLLNTLIRKNVNKIKQPSAKQR